MVEAAAVEAVAVVEEVEGVMEEEVNHVEGEVEEVEEVVVAMDKEERNSLNKELMDPSAVGIEVAADLMTGQNMNQKFLTNHHKRLKMANTIQNRKQFITVPKIKLQVKLLMANWFHKDHTQQENS